MEVGSPQPIVFGEDRWTSSKETPPSVKDTSLEKHRPPQKTNVILCSIPNDAALDGIYKYSLEGMFEPLDPPLQVIQPQGPP